MSFSVTCNQDDVIYFLLKNSIPFVSLCHYDQELVVWDGQSEWYYSAPNVIESFSSKIGTETFTAHDDDLNGIDANSVQVHFLDASAPPDAIIDLSGTPGDASATLNWSAPTSVYPITSYEVHYSTDNFVNDDQTCVDTSCTDTTTGANVPGLTNGVKYYFKVYSHNQNGISAASNVINLTPLAPPPAAINDLGGNAGNGNATLTWSAPNSSAPITSYIVQYSTDNFSNQNNTQTCKYSVCILIYFGNSYKSKYLTQQFAIVRQLKFVTTNLGKHYVGNTKMEGMELE